jgi:hypothetical protein
MAHLDPGTEDPLGSKERVSVQKRIRAEVTSIAVAAEAGEYIQYVMSSPSPRPHFSLMDVTSNDLILSDRVVALMTNPWTYTRLWPVVGDHPRHQSAIVLAMNFTDAENLYNFKVQQRKVDGTWVAVIDIDFVPSTAGDWYLYTFSVVTE